MTLYRENGAYLDGADKKTDCPVFSTETVVFAIRDRNVPEKLNIDKKNIEKKEPPVI